jgi:hypothetical protein
MNTSVLGNDEDEEMESLVKYYKGLISSICLSDNKKTPEGVSLSEKFPIPDYFIISHTKPSISKNTARKMLESYIRKEIVSICLSVIGDMEKENDDVTAVRNCLRYEQRLSLKEKIG